MSLLLDQNSTNNKKAITPTKIPEGKLSSLIYGNMSNTFVYIYMYIKVITKLPNSEQSYKGKVKTHNYINRQNQSTTGKL